MSKARRVYPLRGFGPELIAVAFAKTSRSPESFDKIAQELNDEKSSQFHEKWVVGYGHSSVAEHAVLNIAIENVSRLAVESIEGNRLASYTEKSSRYQIFDSDAYVCPTEIENSELKDFYHEKMREMFANYLELQEYLEKYYLENQVLTRNEGENERFFKVRLKAYALDRARFIMPLATLANLGWTVNARTLEHALQKMFSHEISEVREIAEEIKNNAKNVLPTLIKYTDKSDYLADTTKEFEKMYMEKEQFVENKEIYANLVQKDENAEDRLICAIIYKFSNHSYEEIWKMVQNMSQNEKLEKLKKALEKLGRFDKPLREFEYANFSFDCLIDQGAYFDLKRHRMCSQSAQKPTICHGVLVPEIPEKALEIFQRNVKIAEEGYQKVYKNFPELAPYFVLNAHKRRFLWQMNFREVMYVIKLRSKKAGHFTYRRFARMLYEEFKKYYPVLAKYVDCCMD